MNLWHPVAIPKNQARPAFGSIFHFFAEPQLVGLIGRVRCEHIGMAIVGVGIPRGTCHRSKIFEPTGGSMPRSIIWTASTCFHRSSGSVVFSGCHLARPMVQQATSNKKTYGARLLHRRYVGILWEWVASHGVTLSMGRS